MKNAFRDVKGTAESIVAEQGVPKFRSGLTAYHCIDIRAEEITPGRREVVFLL